MSYYNKHDSPSWEFFAICILLIIILQFMASCASHNVWNNGICSCGGNYKFEQAIGHRNYTSYMYICDKCGRSIEIENYYPED